MLWNYTVTLVLSLKLIFGLCASKQKLQNPDRRPENSKEQLKMCYLHYVCWLHVIISDNETIACIGMMHSLPYFPPFQPHLLPSFNSYSTYFQFLTEIPPHSCYKTLLIVP